MWQGLAEESFWQVKSVMGGGGAIREKSKIKIKENYNFLIFYFYANFLEVSAVKRNLTTNRQ